MIRKGRRECATLWQRYSRDLSDVKFINDGSVVTGRVDEQALESMFSPGDGYKAAIMNPGPAPVGYVVFSGDICATFTSMEFRALFV